MKRSEIMSLRVQQDPYETYRHQRETAPFVWDATMNAWLAFAHKDISKVLKSKDFSADRVSRAPGALQAELPRNFRYYFPDHDSDG